MATSAIYRVPHRRRKEGKTDYKLRLGLLKSGRPRAVIRKSNRYIRASIIVYDPDGDRCVVSADSRELKKFGWTLSCKNLPAAYLTGYLCGRRALKKDIKSAVSDLGLYDAKYNKRLYAVLKGLIDSGVEIPADESKFPQEERLRGEHIKEYSEVIKEKNLKSPFSSDYPAAQVAEIFEKVKNSIEGV